MDKDHYLLDVKASLISGLTSSRRCTNGIYYNDQLLSPNQELQEQFIQGISFKQETIFILIVDTTIYYLFIHSFI